MLHVFSAVFGTVLKPLIDTVASPFQTGKTGIGSPLPRAPEHGGCIYLDYQATTPVWPEVAAAAMPFLTHHWGNPSSGHAFARPCAAAVNSARASVAALIGAKEDEIIFTACGSESDNHAIVGALEAEEERRRSAGDTSSPLPHVVASNIEHPAIEQCLEALKKVKRLTVTYVPCDGEGRVSTEAVAKACTEQTILVTVMHSNNEVGSVLPIADIAKAVKAARPSILVHTDAAQSIGKVRFLRLKLCFLTRTLLLVLIRPVDAPYSAPLHAHLRWTSTSIRSEWICSPWWAISSARRRASRLFTYAPARTYPRCCTAGGRRAAGERAPRVWCY